MRLLIFLVAFAAFLASSFALKNEICGQPHSRNGNGKITCEAYIPSWTYDSSANKCVKFVYGGCGGNENRFVNKEICEEKCLQ
ncbi:male accessory gland serine protease inhibitor-like [Drosophila kikkawai]|uniref:Male accessory gland serine protease inhibitor-like n=1 Tax=Drosophila kikkawai TaxID=30033 RepID=A0A6P4JTK5_DROKI|nr:male accessory gland serine protease inhibitor-like [Drosophila kikkawai]